MDRSVRWLSGLWNRKPIHVGSTTDKNQIARVISHSACSLWMCSAKPSSQRQDFPYLGAKSVDVLMAHREVVLASLCLLGSRDAREEVA